MNKKFQCRLHTHWETQFWARLSFGEIRRSSSPRRTRNTSRSTSISDSSSASKPKRGQARSEMYSRHLVLGLPLGCFPVGVDRFTAGIARFSRFGEVAGHSVPHGFQTCAHCHEVSHSGLFANIPPLPSAFLTVLFQSSPKIDDHMWWSEQKTI